MKNKDLRVFFISDKEYKEIIIKDNINEFYKILNCRCFDIVSRYVNGLYLDFIIDDEGKLKDNYISAFGTYNGEIVETINGAFLVSKANEKGEQINLTDNDIKEIKSHLRIINKPFNYIDTYNGSKQETKINQVILNYEINAS